MRYLYSNTTRGNCISRWNPCRSYRHASLRASTAISCALLPLRSIAISCPIQLALGIKVITADDVAWFLDASNTIKCCLMLLSNVYSKIVRGLLTTDPQRMAQTALVQLSRGIHPSGVFKQQLWLLWSFELICCINTGVHTMKSVGVYVPMCRLDKKEAKGQYLKSNFNYYYLYRRGDIR